tara:strand:+ start:265 stop:411 length:147 start_codon:yes stop_codon:yes gene_type:complete
MAKKKFLINNVFEDFKGKIGKRAKPIILSKKLIDCRGRYSVNHKVYRA